MKAFKICGILPVHRLAHGYHGWPMDALRERMESDLDVIMIGTWMLSVNGCSLSWTLSWLAHGCSV